MFNFRVIFSCLSQNFRRFMPLLSFFELTILIGTGIFVIIKKVHYEEKHTGCTVVLNIFLLYHYALLLSISIFFEKFKKTLDKTGLLL